MKLVRYGAPGRERPGLIDVEGQLRSLAKVIDDIDPSILAPKSLARLAKLKRESLPLVHGERRLGVPLTGISKFVGIGLNYSDHAAEAGLPLPKEPIIFMKAPSSLCGAGDPIVLPRGSQKTDWEVELGIVIGTKARYVNESQALSYVAGYCVVNDVSEREYQLERGSQWDKGKGCDTFGPVGPWLVTADEVGNPQNLELWLDVNGERKQRGNTARMIFGVATLVSCVSHYMTLLPGDLITTGTPPGVGFAMKPPQFLRAGDVVRLGIERLGEQRCVVKSE